MRIDTKSQGHLRKKKEKSHSEKCKLQIFHRSMIVIFLENSTLSSLKTKQKNREMLSVTVFQKIF